MTGTLRPLRGGIIAAGFGSRLRSTAPGRATPKALTVVNGRTLIDWVLSNFDAAGVADTVVIVNEQSAEVRRHVLNHPPLHQVRWIVETTPSSMHSFLRVLEELVKDGEEQPFLISTVDTVAPPGTFARFIALSEREAAADVVVALTTLIEDEHPFLVDISDAAAHAGRVTAVGQGRYATAGYYLVRSTVLREAAAARCANFTALRLFVRHLFERGYTLSGICMPPSVDVDRPSDIISAERLLRTAAS